jgi:hypothetical protein
MGFPIGEEALQLSVSGWKEQVSDRPVSRSFGPLILPSPITGGTIRFHSHSFSLPVRCLEFDPCRSVEFAIRRHLREQPW